MNAQPPRIAARNARNRQRGSCGLCGPARSAAHPSPSPPHSPPAPLAWPVLALLLRDDSPQRGGRPQLKKRSRAPAQRVTRLHDTERDCPT